MLAPESARPHGDWSVFERSPGVLQWAFRKHPLYRYVLDEEGGSLQGSDVPGWHNVYHAARAAASGRIHGSEHDFGTGPGRSARQDHLPLFLRR